MKIKIQNPAEAFAAIATVVISADKISTLEERKYLFYNVKGLDIFEKYNDDEFVKLLVTVSGEMSKILPLDNLAISQEDISQFCEEVKKILSAEHIKVAFTMACELAYSDGLVESEEILLNQLQSELGFNKAVGMEILDQASQLT